MVAVAEGMRPTATHQEKNAMPNTIHRRINILAGFITALSALLPLAGTASTTQTLWPEGGMPDAQAGVAAPYLEWSDAPATNTGS